MRPRYKVSQAGVDLIEAFEGLRPKAARLDDGRWTIGYGHTRSAREDAEVSREDALILLRWVDLPPVEEAINALVSAPLTQNQYDALVAFVFNVGVDAFGESEVLEHLNAGRPTEAACALELWRKADIAGDPVVLDALIRRRAAEKALFLTPRDGFAPTPSPLVRPRPDARAAQFVPARRPAEVEAPMAGERAEARLVVPYEIEPEPEAPTALAPERFGPEPVESEPAPEPTAEPIAEPASESAPGADAPTAEAAEAAEAAPEDAAAPLELLATWSTWTAWAGKVAEAVVGEAEPAAATESVEAPEEAPTAWTVEAVAEPEPDAASEAEPEAEPAPAPTASSEEAPHAEAPQEEAPIASTAEAEEAGAQDAAPTVWSLELPHAVSAALEEPAPTAWTIEPAETDWDEPAPSSWILGVTPVAAPAAETPPAGSGAEPPAAEPAAEPHADAAPEVEAATGAETAPAGAPEPEEVVREVAAANSVLQTRALPEAAPRPRPLYSSYGPMAFAVAPPPKAAAAPAASAVEPSHAALEEVAAGQGVAIQERAAAAAPQPAPTQPPRTPTFQRPAFQPLPELTVPTAALEPAQPVRSFAPPVPAEARAPATASAPAVTAEAAPAKPLVLTSPPADWEAPRAASTKASLAAETDELETPLFDEGWDGPGALSGRIVHHEAPVEHDARATRLRVTGPYVLLGFIGFVAFGGALFAFSRGRAAGAGAGNPVVLAWILALIGAACVGISVYFLLKRLGGQED